MMPPKHFDILISSPSDRRMLRRSRHVLIFLQRQKDALMVPNPRENSRGGRISRETSGRLAYVEQISPRTLPVRSNAGETSGSSLVQRQKDALMVLNPRENSRGGRISRETSGRLAYVGNMSPTIVIAKGY